MVSGTVEEKDCIMYELELDEYREENGYGRILQKGYLDMIPRNCFVKDGELLWFDQEWVLDHLPSKFILLRAMLITYDRVEELADLIPREELLERYGLYDCLKVVDSFTQLFEGTIQEINRLDDFMEKSGDGIYAENVRKLFLK